MQPTEGQFLSGGYYVALRSDRGAHTSVELIPPKILSGSNCISKFFPDSWAIRWCSTDEDERKESAAAFQISERIETTVQWATDSFNQEFGWPNVFYSLESALAARSEFLPRDLDVVVFGLGLHRDDSDSFLGYAKPPHPTPGYAPQGETGIYQCVHARQSIAGGGKRLGFELVATFLGILTCSWLCNGLETDLADGLGVRPNEYGFIENYSDARRCAEYVSRSEVGAEPGLWLPWLVTVYSE